MPTRTGMAFLAVLLLMLIGSINYNASLGYMLTFWLGSLFLVSIFHTYRNLAGLTINTGRAGTVHAGDLAAFELTLVNRAAHVREGVMVRYNPNDDEPVSPAGRAARSALLRATLGPRSNTPVTLGVRAIRRGWLPLEKVEVATRFPLGLIRAWSVVDAQMAALVYPRPAGTPGLPAAGADAGAEGVVGGKGNEDFAGLRSYRSGDPVRHIHWKAASRSDDLPLKEFSGTVSPDLILNYDEVPGDGESRLSQLTLWALEAEAHGFRYGLVVPGGRVAPSRGDAHLHECLAQLALHGGAQR